MSPVTPFRVIGLGKSFNSMKSSIEGLLFFEERYPMLYAMVTKEEGFDYASLEYFLNMRNKIIKNELSVEEASKEVGQVWFDKYCNTILKSYLLSLYHSYA
mgnify:CR=1 FL=1